MTVLEKCLLEVIAGKGEFTGKAKFFNKDAKAVRTLLKTLQRLTDLGWQMTSRFELEIDGMEFAFSLNEECVWVLRQEKSVWDD